MIKFYVLIMIVAIVATTLYLVIRHFHRKWWWQDKVNESRMRQAVLDEFNVQYEVDEQGVIRPTRKREPTIG